MIRRRSVQNAFLLFNLRHAKATTVFAIRNKTTAKTTLFVHTQETLGQEHAHCSHNRQDAANHDKGPIEDLLPCSEIFAKDLDVE